MDKKPLIILTGPTSVGKTALSIMLAKAVHGEIISADSMQVYKGMDIGTAKITPEEMEGVPHHLISEIDPKEEFNVVRFQQYAKEYIRQIHEKNKIPILVGGTGFYIQSVLYDIDFSETEAENDYRLELEQLLLDKGPDHLHEMLRGIDPQSADSLHPNNSKRVIRALEYAKQTGEKISDHNQEQKNKTSPYEYCYFVLTKDRARLYESINHRVDGMLERGLLEEVSALAAKGYKRDMVSMQGIGYKELLAYFDQECTLDEAIELLKKDTRHYAKRQLTWFKREREVIWIDKELYSSEEEILGYMRKELENKNIL